MTLYFLGLAALVAAGLSAVLLRHRPALADRSYGLLAGAGCVLAALPAVRVLAGGPAVGGHQLGSWAFGIDLLSAAFLLVVLVPGLASALYGVRTREPPPGRRAALRDRAGRPGAGRYGAERSCPSSSPGK